jgi:hypothetical protein
MSVDPAGLVFSILNLPKSIIDLYDIVTTAQNAAEDIEYQMSLLRTEKLKYIGWCENVGIIDATKTTESIDPSKISAALEIHLPEGGAEYKRQHIVDLMTGMEQTLADIQQLLSKYHMTGSERTWSLLRRFGSKKGRPIPATLGLVHEVAASMDEDMKFQPKSNLYTKTGWTVHGKKDLTAMVQKVEAYNRSLRSLLGDEVIRRHDMLLDLAVLNSSLASQLSNLNSSDVSSRILSRRDRLIVLSQMVDRSRSLANLDESTRQEIEQGESEAAGKEGSNNRANITRAVGVGDHLYLDVTKLQLQDPVGQDFSERQLGAYQAKPVVVEWRYYSGRLTREGQTVMHDRIHMLCMQLSQSSSIPDFSVLPCLGLFHQKDEKRYGIVFAYPAVFTKLISLRDRLAFDYVATKEGRNPYHSLNDRLCLARSISRSVFYFFQVHWLHKNLRSDSFLLFEESGMDSTKGHHLPKIYLGGFGFSRRDESTDLTEALPSAYQVRVKDDLEWQLSVHPQLQKQRRGIVDTTPGASETDHSAPISNMLFEAYSLGVVLLQIALWSPAQKLLRRGTPVEEFRQEALVKYLPKVRSLMGDAYWEVVRRCLTGDFGEIYIRPEEGAAGVESEESIDKQLFLEAFGTLVVAELETLL